MDNDQLGHLLLGITLLLLGANVLGQLFSKLRQPKVIGEIVAGLLLGPSILGRLAPDFARSTFGTGAPKGDFRAVGLDLVAQLGLLLLMFVSGSHVRDILGRENRRETGWLLGVGTAVPFAIALVVVLQLPVGDLLGPADSTGALALVFAAAVAVTSIPVITKIFSDLGILHTRFASLLLGMAVLEDIMLWGVLSVATAIATASIGATQGELTQEIVTHVGINLAYVAVTMTLMPRVLRWLGRASWNRIAVQTPVTWALLVLLGYVCGAIALGVTPVFAAFLAGFGLIGGVSGSERQRVRQPLDNVAAFSQGLFVPLYFAVVGFKLDFTQHFSLWITGAFLVGSSVLNFACGVAAARFAGFRGRATFNIAVTGNARGGPGIVLASVAFDAGIISAEFFTALVITAVVTSQICGVWLDVVLRRGWSLLGSGSDDETVGRRAALPVTSRR